MKQPTSLVKLLAIVLGGTLIILSIPYLAMQYTDDVKWSPSDFVIAGVLLFSGGSGFVIFVRQSHDLFYKLGVAAGAGGMFLMLWANLAVGLIGSGPTIANASYFIIALGAIGLIIKSYASPRTLSRIMFSVSASLLVHAILVTFLMAAELSGSAREVFGVNAFFAAIFLVSALLFTRADFHLQQRRSV